MKHWLRLNAQALARSLGAIVRHPFHHLFNLLVIAIAAALPFGFYVLLSNLDHAVDTLPVEPQLSVFMRTDAPDSADAAVKEKLAGSEIITHIRFVPKDEALKELQQRTSNDALLAGLTDNPLPDAFVATARADAGAASMDQLQRELSRIAGVDDVQADSAWAARLDKLLGLGRTLLEVLVVLLGGALALLTGNAIRMQILTRHDEIEVAKLIGATDAFIRRPFLYSAALHGLIGGALAIGIVAAVVSHINPAISALAHSYGQTFALALPGPLEILAVCGVTTLLAIVGAWVAVWRHVRRFI
ncbi:permease-like cell division protein FtsX [Chitinibacteraceae bacterium HSL-7]